MVYPLKKETKTKKKKTSKTNKQTISTKGHARSLARMAKSNSLTSDISRFTSTDMSQSISTTLAFSKGLEAHLEQCH